VLGMLVHRSKYFNFRLLPSLFILIPYVFLFVRIAPVRHVFLNERLGLSKLRESIRGLLLEADCGPLEHSSHIFWVDLLEVGDVLDIFKQFLNHHPWFGACLKGHQMLLELVSPQVIVFQNQSVPVHNSQALGKNVLWVQIVRHGL
jgi:hypothetical protein